MNEFEVLHFWFEELTPEQWFVKDSSLDARIRERFFTLHTRASRCELFTWRRSSEGRLAEIIVLDQFSRNMYRDNVLAFATDPLALALAQEAVNVGADQTLPPQRKAFMYLPFMHSESPLIHETAMKLFQAGGLEDNLNFEIRHKKIIDRFGRFPHRNVVLGRPSTAEEIEFLKEPGSSF